MTYRKARPDSARFAVLDKHVVDEISLEKRPAAVMLASWLVGGVAYDERRVTTPKGMVTVPVNHTWGSLTSVQEDALSATGCRFGYQALRGAVATLHEAGLVVDRYDPLPATRGKYGTVFALGDGLLAPPNVPIDPVRGYRAFVFGDPTEYRYGEIVTGTLGRGAVRGRKGLVQSWQETVAAEGIDFAAFTTIGRWKRNDAFDPLAPVLVPWFVLDVDRNSLRKAWDDTQDIAQRLFIEGFSLDRTFVSFSGRRGFHVQISADQLGCPIFRDSDAARIACEELTSYVATGIETDPSVNSPMSLIRLTGSLHEKTSLYKVTWSLGAFMKMEFEEAMNDAHNGKMMLIPDPIAGQVEQDVFEIFENNIKEAVEERYANLRDEKTKGGTGAGRVIRRIVEGVGESDNWSPLHSGRNKAAFVLACFVLEDRDTGDHEIDSMRRNKGPEAAMETWNRRNAPPLPARELFSAYSSAHRRILGTRPPR